ncbi:MAG: hypothetical protein ACI9MC_003616 [Kiritimatiellia bacterium]|jgi:hypothetical protein
MAVNAAKGGVDQYASGAPASLSTAGKIGFDAVGKAAVDVVKRETNSALQSEDSDSKLIVMGEEITSNVVGTVSKAAQAETLKWPSSRAGGMSATPAAEPQQPTPPTAGTRPRLPERHFPTPEPAEHSLSIPGLPPLSPEVQPDSQRVNADVRSPEPSSTAQVVDKHQEQPA